MCRTPLHFLNFLMTHKNKSYECKQLINKYKKWNHQLSTLVCHTPLHFLNFLTTQVVVGGSRTYVVADGHGRSRDNQVKQLFHDRGTRRLVHAERIL